MLISIPEAQQLLGLTEAQVKDISAVVMSEAAAFVMPFGKWNGKSLSQVPEDYVHWFTSSVYFKNKVSNRSALFKHMVNFFEAKVTTTSQLKLWFNDMVSIIEGHEAAHFNHTNDLMPFGKYKDMTFMQIADYDVSYLSWIVNKEDCTLDREVIEAIKSMIE
jgi:uncharacterized protein (DUF3820 family)